MSEPSDLERMGVPATPLSLSDDEFRERFGMQHGRAEDTLVIGERCPKGWTSMRVGLPYPRPQNWREWRRVAWGSDIFIGRVPVIRSCAALTAVAVAAAVAARRR